MEARRREHEHEERERLEPVERRGHVYQPRMAEHRDLVHWGPVWVGFMSAFGVLIVLALLAAAVGFSVASPGATGAPSGASIVAGIVSVVAVLISFFAGGWMAGRTSSVRGDFAAIALGTTVWALGLVFLVLLMAIGVTGLLGVFAAYFAAFGGAPAGPPGTAITMAAGTAITTLIGAVLTWIVTVVGARLGVKAGAPEIESY